jgi:hypothetical protein
MNILDRDAITRCQRIDILISTETPTLKVRIDMEFENDVHVRAEIAPSAIQETALHALIGATDDNCVRVVDKEVKMAVIDIINKIES